MRNAERILDLIGDNVATNDDLRCQLEALKANQSAYLQQMVSAIASEPELAGNSNPFVAAILVIGRLKREIAELKKEK
jgi:hypothetical protein